MFNFQRSSERYATLKLPYLTERFVVVLHLQDESNEQKLHCRLFFARNSSSLE